jgi:hypothetical protein
VLGTSSDVIPSHRRAAAPSPWPPLPYTLGSPLLSPTPYGLNPISKERCPAPHYGGEQGEAATGSWGGATEGGGLGDVHAPGRRTQAPSHSSPQGTVSPHEPSWSPKA